MNYKFIFKILPIFLSTSLVITFLVVVDLILSHNIIAQDTSIKVNNLVNKGLELYYPGDYTGAISYYDKALSIDLNNLAGLE
jgi:hypothetical protein